MTQSDNTLFKYIRVAEEATKGAKPKPAEDQTAAVGLEIARRHQPAAPPKAQPSMSNGAPLPN